MGRELATRLTDTLLPCPSVNQGADAAFQHCLPMSYRQGGTLFMMNMPTPEMLGALRARRNELLALTHDRKQIRVLIGEMLEGCRDGGIKPGENAEKVIEVYVREMSLDPKVPTWAVWRACGAIRLGHVRDIAPYKAPTTMQLRRLCDEFLRPYRVELMHIGDILRGKPSAPPVSPEERKRVSDGWRDLAAELKADGAAETEFAGLTATDLEALVGAEAWKALPDAKPKSVPTVGELVATALAQSS